MNMKPDKKNERMNEQIKAIISIFGADPNAVAMGMYDDVKHESTKAFMLDDIIDIMIDGLKQAGFTVDIEKVKQ